jgi:uncharacterized protein YdbL (DUF1318 family)
MRLLPILLLPACVTVNVYFPSAAAEQAADRIIDTVTAPATQRPEEPKPQSAPPAQQPPTTRAPAATGAGQVLLAMTGRVLELIVPAAQAQASANLDISTPQVRAITGSMQQRFGQLQPFFNSGVVGLTADGLVAVRDGNAVPLADRATVTRLVSEDNRDREALYAEIAKANGHPEWEGDIRRTFARRWVQRGAQPGWYYQDASGKWQQK